MNAPDADPPLPPAAEASADVDVDHKPAPVPVPVPDKAAQPQRRNPLHGLTLEVMLTELVDHFGWSELGARVHIRSFNLDPSIASSLKFLRKTPWAREKVEGLYLFMKREQARDKPR